MKRFKICTLIEKDGKLVSVSEEIQKKLFSLGYKWVHCGAKLAFIEQPFLYTDESGYITYGEIKSIENFVKNSEYLITFDELMKLETEVKYNFKPFQKVLVRDENNECWKPELFSRILERPGSLHNYRTVGGCYWKQCIPYDDNEQFN